MKCNEPLPHKDNYYNQLKSLGLMQKKVFIFVSKFVVWLMTSNLRRPHTGFTNYSYPLKTIVNDLQKHDESPVIDEHTFPRLYPKFAKLMLSKIRSCVQ